MKNIFLKLILFLTLSTLIIYLLGKMISNPFWGNRQIAGKYNYLQKETVDPNIYFIGSSNTIRHINPSQFDHCLNNGHFQSFNLASDGCYPMQNNFVLKELLEKDTSISYVFFELNSFDHYGGKRYLSTKAKYYMNFKYLYTYVNYLLYDTVKETKSNNYNKDVLLKKYITTFFENLYRLGERRDFLSYFFDNEDYTFREDMLGPEKNGFVPLKGDIVTRDGMAERLPRVMKMSKNVISKAYTSIDKEKYNKTLLSFLENQIEFAKSKQVKLIYILPPKSFILDSFQVMLNTFSLLPDENKIDLANPTKYPIFYLVENRWDGGHFNAKGARKYTSRLCTEFQKLIN